MTPDKQKIVDAVEIVKDKWQHWQVVQKCRELGTLCDETDYGQEKFTELEHIFIEYLRVGDYLEARCNGVDLAKSGCPICKKSSDVLEVVALYEKLSENKKKMAMRFMLFLLHDVEG